MAHVCGKFVSRKIQTVRWRPTKSDSFQKSDCFVTGSWDDSQNLIGLWHYAQDQSIGNGDDEDNGGKLEPNVLWERPVAGDVTDIRYLNTDVLVSSSSTGNVSLYKHNTQQNLELLHTWDHLHKFKCSAAPCTAIATLNDEIVSVGEDGRLCVLSARDKTVTRIIDADCSSIAAVTYLKQNEVMVANSLGHLNVWDLRTKGNSPNQTLLFASERIPICCVTQHPAQPQVVASGDNDGSLVIWDLRQDSNVATLGAHDGAVMDVKFHPTAPNHMFTCSMDGTLWHWDASVLADTAKTPSTVSKPGANVSGSSNPWLKCGGYQHRLEISALLPPVHQPINSLDILEDTLLCGADNEAIYLIRMGMF